MFQTKRLLATAAFTLPLSFTALVATDAHAAGLIEAAKNTGQFSTLVKALEQSGMAQQLEGEGPFTVFAPTDAAFESLPQGVVDGLMRDENKGQLTQLLQHHVVQGQKLMIKDALGKQTQVGTLTQDQLTVDGTNQMTVVVPTGLQITRIGDELVAERTAAVTTLPAVTVEPTMQQQNQGGQQQGQANQGASQQPNAQPVQGAQQTGQGSQRQQALAAQAAVQSDGQGASGPQPQPVQGAQTTGPGAPQQQAQAARSAPQQGGEAAPQQQAQNGQGGQGAQQQAQSGQAAQGAQQRSPLDRQEGIFRAAVITQPQVEADNGVIHGINEVLVPEKLEAVLMDMHTQDGTQQGAAQPKPNTGKPTQG